NNVVDGEVERLGHPRRGSSVKRSIEDRIPGTFSPLVDVITVISVFFLPEIGAIAEAYAGCDHMPYRFDLSLFEIEHPEDACIHSQRQAVVAGGLKTGNGIGNQSVHTRIKVFTERLEIPAFVVIEAGGHKEILEQVKRSAYRNAVPYAGLQLVQGLRGEQDRVARGYPVVGLH